MSPVRATAFLLTCLATVTAACAPAPQRSGPRLVVLYATCSLNKAFLSPYDPGVRFTPRFEAFAQESLVFRRHQTESGQSGTAFASLFSGTQAITHGIYRHPTRMADEVYLITEAFAEAGWDAHSFLAHPMASAALNYAQGVPPENVHHRFVVAGSRGFARILDRLEADPDYRAFVVTNFTLTHGPYRGARLDEFCARHPDECSFLEAPGGRKRFKRLKHIYRKSHVRLAFDFDRTVERLGLDEADVADLREVTTLLYKTDVFELDGVFGELLDLLGERGLEADTLFAMTSDHGEVLYREDAYFHWTHGFQLAPEALGVAFLLRGPSAGVPSGVYENVTRSMDVFPTLAGLSGIELPESTRRGRNLAAAIRGEEPEPELLAYSHTSLFTDEIWKRYRRHHQLAALFPRGNDPDQLWAAVRSGDEFHRLRRPDGPEGAWQHDVVDLSVPLVDGVLRATPPAPETAAVGEQLQRYKALLSEGHARGANRKRGVDSDRTVELLRSIGYIDD